MVTTPTGKPVAMVHCNNCTGDLDGWTRLFGEAAALFGAQVEKSALYNALYNKALEGDADCGGLLNYNYFSGEPITGLETGRPLFMREPDAKFNLANFMRCQIFSALATLRLGMDILLNENVKITALRGHGGLYKTEGVGQKITAAALEAPVTVMESAGEGGAWGIALLAAYRLRREPGETLETYLERRVFAGVSGSTVEPDMLTIQGFAGFMKRWKAGLAAEKAAAQ
jgi:sugar (pentulose or hexulose) kinase